MSNPVSSVLQLKCPKCRQGDLFCNKKIYQYNHFFDMPKKCPKCGQDFQIETGFYYGAMYVSYAITIALIVAVFIALIVFNIFSIELFLLLDFIVLLISLPYVFKVSRSIWIALMIKFDSKAVENYERKA